MTWYQILYGVTLILSSIGIIVVVIMQLGRQAGLSGAIAGGAETFFGKNKGRSIEAKLAKITKIVAAIFFVAALVASILIMLIYICFYKTNWFFCHFRGKYSTSY